MAKLISLNACRSFLGERQACVPKVAFVSSVGQVDI